MRPSNLSIVLTPSIVLNSLWFISKPPRFYFHVFFFSYYLIPTSPTSRLEWEREQGCIGALAFSAAFSRSCCDLGGYDPWAAPFHSSDEGEWKTMRSSTGVHGRKSRYRDVQDLLISIQIDKIDIWLLLAVFSPWTLDKFTYQSPFVNLL